MVRICSILASLALLSLLFACVRVMVDPVVDLFEEGHPEKRPRPILTVVPDPPMCYCRFCREPERAVEGPDTDITILRPQPRELP